jgi:6-pyruvoyltetrahydropterin/6-carboxytetrahydropterin synthase
MLVYDYMKTSITKQFRFEAAHSLPEHSGKCRNLHGHSYLLEVTVTGDVQTSGSAAGMVIDFAELSDIVDREILSQWDHQYLNDIVSFTTSAENLAGECFRRLTSAGLDISRVVLWETAKAYATIEK